MHTYAALQQIAACSGYSVRMSEMTFTLMGLFGANFSFIFLKALQQLHVQGNHHLAVFPTSFGLASCEVFLITRIAHAPPDHLWAAVAVLGVASGLGCISAMFFHRWRVKK